MPQERSIPQLVVASPPSEELICLHEAGHVMVSLDCGVVPDLLEMLPGSLAGARVRTPPTGNNRQVISLGGFAAELNLFLAGRLVDEQGDRITEKTLSILLAAETPRRIKRPTLARITATRISGRRLWTENSWSLDTESPLIWICGESSCLRGRCSMNAPWIGRAFWNW